MKLRKHVNMNSIIAVLTQLQEHCAIIKTDFSTIIQMFDNQKLGINEMNYNLDEELARFRNTFAKFEDLVRSIQ